MYCQKCGKEIADGSTFCNHCGTKQGENEVKSTVDKKALFQFIGLVLSVPVIFLLYMMFAPLDNDADCIRASKEAHPLIHNTYDDNGCSVCHPIMWRFNVRLLRNGYN